MVEVAFYSRNSFDYIGHSSASSFSISVSFPNTDPSSFSFDGSYVPDIKKGDFAVIDLGEDYNALFPNGLVAFVITGITTTNNQKSVQAKEVTLIAMDGEVFHSSAESKKYDDEIWIASEINTYLSNIGVLASGNTGFKAEATTNTSKMSTAIPAGVNKIQELIESASAFGITISSEVTASKKLYVRFNVHRSSSCNSIKLDDSDVVSSFSFTDSLDQAPTKVVLYNENDTTKTTYTYYIHEDGSINMSPLGSVSPVVVEYLALSDDDYDSAENRLAKATEELEQYYAEHEATVTIENGIVYPLSNLAPRGSLSLFLGESEIPSVLTKITIKDDLSNPELVFGYYRIEITDRVRKIIRNS